MTVTKAAVLVYETASACLCGKLRRTHSESLDCSQYKTFKVVEWVLLYRKWFHPT